MFAQANKEQYECWVGIFFIFWDCFGGFFVDRISAQSCICVLRCTHVTQGQQKMSSSVNRQYRVQRQYTKYLLCSLPLFGVGSSEWKPAVDLAAIDCAENWKTCSGYSVTGYPTIKVPNRKEFIHGRTHFLPFSFIIQ